MLKKSTTMLVLGALSLFCSCVDRSYDLVNKEISTDVKIEGNKIPLPVGNLKPVVLDSLINVDSIDILNKTPDGVYSINIEDSISPIEVNVDSIKISINPIDYFLEMDFKDAEITEVHVEGEPVDPIQFDVPNINIREINDELPELEAHSDREVTSDAVKDLLDRIANNSMVGSQTIRNFKSNVDVDSTLECNFTYTLPEEIETINSIKFTSADGDQSKGTLAQIKITNPKALSGVKKEVDFEIEFPEYFLLSKDPASSDDVKLSYDRHKITLDNYTLEGNESVFSFYIDEMTGLADKIENGVLNINEEIKYTVNYDATGDLVVNNTVKKEDFVFSVDMDVPLMFKDASGRMKDVTVSFEPVLIDFRGEFDNLQYIDTIYYIEFDKSQSKIHLNISMDTEWLNSFTVNDGYALRIDFPDGLTFDDSMSEYEGKGKEVVYNADEHAFYVHDLRMLSNAQWDLALSRLQLDVPVIDGDVDIDIEAEISFVTDLVLQGCELESMVETLDMLGGDKTAEVNLQTSDLLISDASIHTEVIYSEIDAHSDFSFNESVPVELERIESIEFPEPVALNFDLAVTGLERLGTDLGLDFFVVLPSFLDLYVPEARDAKMNARIQNDTLYVYAMHEPTENNKLRLELMCRKLDFMTEEFNFAGMIPEPGADGKKYLSYSNDLAVLGDAFIDGTEFHSNAFGKSANFDIDVTVGEMKVKTFHGIYNGEISPVDMSFDFNLGGELDFLNDDNNKIKLAEPQIELVLESSAGVPVNLDIQILGKDANGAAITSSEITTQVKVNPADYNDATGEITPKETKIFFTCDASKVSKAGYDNVEIKNLANLLNGTIPSAIDFKIAPAVDTNETHHIDISKPISFVGSYSVIVPFKFDSLQICYSDTIEDLQSSLGEVMDMFSNVGLRLKMDMLNTIPLGLSLYVAAYDADGYPIEGVEIDPIVIKAGVGGNVLESENAQEVQAVELAIKSASGDLSALDKLTFSINAATDHTTGAVGLKGEQGVKISNVVLEVFGDIELDLGEMNVSE